MRPRLSLNVTAIIVLLLVGFGLGIVSTLYSQQVSAPTTLSTALQRLIPAPKNADYNQLVSVWNRLHTDYVNANIDDRALLQGAIGGLVSGLGDPYSSYFNPTESKQFEEEISGTFDGVGMEVGFKNNHVTVIAPLPKSPAERAGLRAGDVILSVGQQDVSSLSLDQVINLIRGPKGTTVNITYQRSPEANPKSVAITRATITVDSVNGRVIDHGGKKFAYLNIVSFNQDTGREFRTMVQSLSAKTVTGVILDLRNNPGGYLDQAVDVASVFITDGNIVSEVDRDGHKKDFNASGNVWWPTIPTVVLVNGGSASAAEIVAGALQDHHRAQLVGTKTFGKGTVQDYQTLSDGSSLKLTIAKWLTPNGSSISEHGITPDFIVDLTDANRAANQDPPLDKGLELLTAAK